MKKVFRKRKTFLFVLKIAYIFYFLYKLNNLEQKFDKNHAFY